MNHRTVILLRKKSTMQHPGSRRAARRARKAWWKVPANLRGELRRRIAVELEGA